MLFHEELSERYHRENGGTNHHTYLYKDEKLEARIEARMAEELGNIAQDLEEEKLIALTVEVDGDQFLCYNAQTMMFVCQGRNLEEIRKRFRERFPSKSAAIYNGDESAVKVLRTQLKELNENSRSIGSAS